MSNMLISLLGESLAQVIAGICVGVFAITATVLMAVMWREIRKMGKDAKKPE